jgi:hypothetical protein
MTPFGAAGTNNSAAPAGFHANQKAMGALATNDGRLVGTLHDKNPNKDKHAITVKKPFFVKRLGHFLPASGLQAGG